MTAKFSPAPQVAVLGAAALDWVARVRELPARDGIAYADQYDPMPGGTGGNVAVGVARLGQSVRFLGVLGGDEGGRILLQAFTEAGVDTHAVRINRDQRSAACFIAIDGQGERLIFSLGGVALYDKPEQVQPAWLAGVRVLFIADAYAEVAAAAMDCLDQEAIVVFNPGGLMASAGEDYLRPIVNRSHVLIASRGESETMTGIAEIEAAARELSRRGPQVVMVTLGSRGALVLERGELAYVAAFPAQAVVDTTGAGDAFTSGVLAGHLEGWTWVEAARLGCAVASIKVGHLGARGGLPDRRQVQDIVKTGLSNSFLER
jgi:sugar/nucleoside kinase (ribokinase family)